MFFLTQGEKNMLESIRITTIPPCTRETPRMALVNTGDNSWRKALNSLRRKSFPPGGICVHRFEATSVLLLEGVALVVRSGISVVFHDASLVFIWNALYAGVGACVVHFVSGGQIWGAHLLARTRRVWPTACRIRGDSWTHHTLRGSGAQPFQAPGAWPRFALSPQGAPPAKKMSGQHFRRAPAFSSANFVAHRSRSKLNPLDSGIWAKFERC